MEIVDIDHSLFCFFVCVFEMGHLKSLRDMQVGLCRHLMYFGPKIGPLKSARYVK